MRKRFLFGFISGIGFTLLAIVILFVVYYQIAMSGVAEENVRARLEPPYVPLYCPNCYPKITESISFQNLEGRHIQLDQLKGRVIFLNFWQTTCIPCLAEMKSIDSLYKRFKNDNIEFILLSDEKLEVVQEFWENRAYSFPVYVIDRVELSKSIFSTRTFPVTYIISNDMRLVLKESKASDWSDKNVIKLLEELISSKQF